MTVILGFFAVLFAIPTFGLSLLGYVVFLWLANRARHAADGTRSRYDRAISNASAQLRGGTVSAPSWAKDAGAAKLLLSECIEAAVKTGLDPRDLSNDTVGEAFAGIAMTAAHHFELQGFSRPEQIVGATDMSVTYAQAHARNRASWDRFFQSG